MKLRHIPFFNGFLPAAFFPRRYANVRRWISRRWRNSRWISVLRRGIATRRPLVALRQGLALRQDSMARQRQVIAPRRPLVALRRGLIARGQGFASQDSIARQRRVIAPQRGSIFLEKTGVAVPSQFIALRRGFIVTSSQPIAVLVWPIAVLSQFIALRRPLRLEVVAVFATELRLRLRCRKWLQRGVCFSSSQSQMGIGRRV